MSLWAYNELKRVFWFLISPKAHKPGPIDEPVNEKVPKNKDVPNRAPEFKTIEVQSQAGT